MVKTMNCPECGNVVATTDQFCSKCYARLEPPSLWRKFLSLFQTASTSSRPLISIKKTINIRTTDKDGVRHEYHSLDDLPPEVREEIKQLESEAMNEAGPSTAVSETSREGNVMKSRFISKKNVSIYKIKDAAGNEQTYHSLDEMPPELRAAIEKATDKTE